MERGRTFDTVADLYDAQRSGYPGALFADLAAIAGLEPGARILEIGCGSGLATAGFVGLGLDVTAVDPGSALVEIARRRFEGAPNVRFEVAAFEDWTPRAEPFRLVAAAQSWHWIARDVGFPKAAALLAPGGHLAIFGHTPVWSAELTVRLAPAYLPLRAGALDPAGRKLVFAGRTDPCDRFGKRPVRRRGSSLLCLAAVLHLPLDGRLSGHAVRSPEVTGRAPGCAAGGGRGGVAS